MEETGAALVSSESSRSQRASPVSRRPGVGVAGSGPAAAGRLRARGAAGAHSPRRSAVASGSGAGAAGQAAEAVAASPATEPADQLAAWLLASTDMSV